jgi:hypothetical protein
MSIQSIFSLLIRIEQKRKHSSAESLVLVKLNGKNFFKHKLRNASLAHLLSSDTRFTVTSSYTGISLLKQSQKNMIDYDSYHLPIGTKKIVCYFTVIPGIPNRPGGPMTPSPPFKRKTN